MSKLLGSHHFIGALFIDFLKKLLYRVIAKYRFAVLWQSPGRDTLKSDDAMFCLPAKAMRLWRDVCFRHVADKNCLALT